MVGLLDVAHILRLKVDVEIPTLDSTYFFIIGGRCRFEPYNSGASPSQQLLGLTHPELLWFVLPSQDFISDTDVTLDNSKGAANSPCSVPASRQ